MTLNGKGDQTGIKILTFQQDVVPISGNDSWIVILFTALFVHAVTWMIYRILDRGHGDLIAVHHDMFGKWFGGNAASRNNDAGRIYWFYRHLYVLPLYSKCEIVAKMGARRHCCIHLRLLDLDDHRGCFLWRKPHGTYGVANAGNVENCDNAFRGTI